MNEKNKYLNMGPVFEVLGWVGTIVLTFLYALFVVVIVCFTGMAYFSVNVLQILAIALGAAAISAVVYPIVRITKYVRRKRYEQKWAKWHEEA